MWWLLSKKKFKRELEKITTCFKKRDLSIEDNSKEIKEIKKDLISKKEEDLMIRETILKVQYEPNYEVKSEPDKQKNFERVILKKANKTRPEVIKQAIRGLIARDMRTTDIFNIIVEEKKLVGKTQFYHYLTLVRGEVRSEIRPELRTKLK